MAKILVINDHPDLKQSQSNRLILAELERHFGAQIEVRRLSELYPAALLKAEVVLLQYPTHWFNLPARLQKWLADVWVFGFAFGRDGSQLQGKKLLASTTTGSPASVYDGQTAPHISELAKPVEASARYAGFHWQGIEALHGALYIPGMHSDADLERVQRQARDYGQRLAGKIEKLL